MSDPALVVRPADVEPVDRGNGVVTLPLVGRWNRDENSVTTGITRFEPGTAIGLHVHNVEETVLVLEGTATAVLEDRTETVPTGSAISVPAGVPHFISNQTDTVLRIYWVYVGRYVTRTLLATGKTVEVMSAEDRSGTQAPS